MKTKTKSSWLFWFAFLGLLSGALILQVSFLPKGEGYKFIPYLTLPAIVFFFLHHNIFSSFCLILFMSFLSGAFSPLPVLSLFVLYFLCLLIVLFVKNFFFFKSSFLFFSLVFTVSLFFPYMVDLSYELAIKDFSLSTNLLYFVKAVVTLVLSLLLFPFLKKHLQEKVGI